MCGRACELYVRWLCGEPLPRRKQVGALPIAKTWLKGSEASESSSCVDCFVVLLATMTRPVCKLHLCCCSKSDVKAYLA